jgi:hypothetical protein
MSDVLNFPGGGPQDPVPPPPAEGGAAPVTGDPVSEAASWSAHNSKLLMGLLAKLIRYQDYCKDMKLDRFTAVLHLAMLDQFSSFDDKTKARKLSTPSGFTFKAEDMPKARESEDYARVHRDLMEKVVVLTAPGTSVDAIAELMEDANSWELLRIAHFAPSPRDRKAALEEFTSRRSAKKGRENQGKEMILPERFIEQLTAGMAAMAVVIQDQHQQISGAKLNVPSAKMIGEGRVEKT